MKGIMLKNCILDKEKIQDAIALGIFGSYHEDCFNKDRSDIDVMILLKKELDWEEEMAIEEYLESCLPGYFQHKNMHYTFINDFSYPFGELLLMSEDKIIVDEESYLEYVLGYSAFKRDREDLEIMRAQNLKELEELRRGVL